MENFYIAYTRVVQNTTFYFVKKYVTFPEFKDVPNVLENYGMHTDFNRACKIAGIYDADLSKKLLSSLQNNITGAKIIPLNNGNVFSAIS
ncbi:MAG: hypothetical protein ACRDE8_00600 [Ginsengibacter sp.]